MLSDPGCHRGACSSHQAARRRVAGWDCRQGLVQSHQFLHGLACAAGHSPASFLTGFDFAPASVHDTRLAETFPGLHAFPSDRLSSVGKQAQTPYVADRAYASQNVQRQWLHDSHAAVLTQPHSRTPVAHPSPHWRRFMHGFRHVIETASGTWHLTFRLATDRLHMLQDFRARLAAKVALHNVCCWLHAKQGRPPHGLC